MNKTPIEWTDFTVNPFRFKNLETGKVGHHCEKISPGCKNCYSAKMQTGPYLSGLDFISENKPKGEFFLDEGALQQVLRRKKPARIFWCDMTDMFLEDYPDEWIDRCFAVMALTPHLTHQVLTKRAGRMRRYFRNASDLRNRWSDTLLDPRNWLADWWDSRRAVLGNPSRAGVAEGLRGGWREVAMKHVHLGVSVEDQQRADERIPELLQTPAAVRFLSVEPLLGPVSFRWAKWHDYKNTPPGPDGRVRHGHLDGIKGIDWVIVGGESGPGARPMNPVWPRSIRDQCVEAGVSFFFKQWGEWLPDQQNAKMTAEGRALASGSQAIRVGKKAAGRLLDGREWNEMPTERDRSTCLTMGCRSGTAQCAANFKAAGSARSSVRPTS